jgi:GntR family transcriptional regulator
MSRTLDRSAAQPLWSQLYDDLTQRLASGEFSDAFPGEHALVDEYGVSRHTVREALRRLRAEGVVTASRGRTSRVSGPAEIEQPLGTLYSLFASVGATGLRQRSVVRDLTVVADAVVADRLGLDGSTPLLYLERLRLAGEQPLALDRVWLPAELARPLLQADFTETALYTELSERCGVRLTGGTEHIRAVVPTPSERESLQVPGDVAAFAIERTGYVGDRPVEWRHTLVRGDRFAVNAEFSGRSGYSLGVSGAALPR